MANIKILCFIKSENIYQFFEKIKEKYKDLFPNFIKYFEKNYLKSDQYGHLTFNYNYLQKDDFAEGIKFYTNNICESFNKTLNTKYMGGAKTFYHFKNALMEILELYKTKNEYKPRYLSITRALAYFCERNDICQLITANDLINIMKEYKFYLINNKALNRFVNEENNDYFSEDDFLNIKNDNIYNNDIIDSDSLKEFSESEKNNSTHSNLNNDKDGDNDSHSEDEDDNKHIEKNKINKLQVKKIIYPKKTIKIIEIKKIILVIILVYIILLKYLYLKYIQKIC